MWKLFAKRSTLGPWKSFSMMQCLCDQPLCKALERFSRILFLLRSGLPWIIWGQHNDLDFNALQWPLEKTRKIIWNALQDYGKIEWQWTLSDLEKAMDVAYQDVLNEFDSIWVSKVLLWGHRHRGRQRGCQRSPAWPGVRGFPTVHRSTGFSRHALATLVPWPAGCREDTFHGGRLGFCKWAFLKNFGLFLRKDLLARRWWANRKSTKLG